MEGGREGRWDGVRGTEKRRRERGKKDERKENEIDEARTTLQRCSWC